MPRTIWQASEYIGHHIWQSHSGGIHPAYRPVWDREENDWIQLNSDVNQVDYELTGITHNKAMLTWEYNIDFIVVRITWYDEDSGIQHTREVASNLQKYVLTGLSSDTEYVLNVVAPLPWGITQSHRQRFRTAKDPIPAPVTGLRYTSRSNTSISLEWNAAARATQYRVYRSEGMGPFRLVTLTNSTSITINLRQDTKYRFMIRAVNPDGFVGPRSNILRSATGSNEKRKTGSVTRISFAPRRWGSWRPDIKWNWWPHHPTPGPNTAIYQGYWQYRNKRYWGVIEYDSAAIRRELDRKYGSGVGANFRVTQASLRRVYRERMPGNIAPQELVWHLTNTKVRATGNQPTVYGKHVNDRNSADAVKAHRAIGAGKGIDMLRLPRRWGEAIIRGKNGNTPVTGLVLHRDDNLWNGYGYAGYAKISGHNEGDYHLGGGGGRKSNLSLVVSGNWNFVVKPYRPPYDW